MQFIYTNISDSCNKSFAADRAWEVFREPQLDALLMEVVVDVPTQRRHLARYDRYQVGHNVVLQTNGTTLLVLLNLIECTSLQRLLEGCVLTLTLESLDKWCKVTESKQEEDYCDVHDRGNKSDQKIRSTQQKH
jgi:hypothetical protein